MQQFSKKIALLAFLAGLVLGTIGVGLYFQHYFVVFVFAVWFCVEFAMWRYPVRGWNLPLDFSGKQGGRRELIGMYKVGSENHLAEKIQFQLRVEKDANERQWLERLRGLTQLRALAFSPAKGKKQRLLQAFIYRPINVGGLQDGPHSREDYHYDHQVIAEGATTMSELYWRLLETAEGNYPLLSPMAKELYAQLFGEVYAKVKAWQKIETLNDAILRDFGIPFLVLNLNRQGQYAWSRVITQELLQGYDDVDIEEDTRSALYWATELNWFLDQKSELIGDYEACIRYLYHLCFTSPDRAGFLEIDSRFFSQFETVSQLAQEGFLFKEVMIDRLMMLWKSQSGLFDGHFKNVLEAMTQQRNKILDDVETWERFWAREREDFCKEYLYVVEGNLCYARGYFEDAQSYYEKALELDPELRSALLNLLFCHAKLGQKEKHEALVEKLQGMSRLFPSVLYAIGDSYFLLGDIKKGNRFYDELGKEDGWVLKVDYYKSIFLYENGIFDEALYYAKRAHEFNPNDTSMSYHLSLCYNAVGEKDQALELVKKLGQTPSPTWMNYYRFTLERDAGRHVEATETLKNIPSEYFEDPTELSEAEAYARSRSDLALLHHLRKKVR